MPAGTAVAILLFFGCVALFSTVCLFASNATLRSLSGVIGTQNPLVARVACLLGALVGWGAVAAAAASLAGWL
jgi:hypothetical protein